MKQETEEEKRQRRDNISRRGGCRGYGGDKTERHRRGGYVKSRRTSRINRKRRSGNFRVNKRGGAAKRGYYRDRCSGGYIRGRDRDGGVAYASETRETDNAMKDVRYPTELSSLYPKF